MNTPRTLPGATRDDLDAAAAVGARPVRSASFVSILVDAATAAERGLPVADYFLWNDDFEYTTRLIRGGVGLYVPTSVVVHKTRVFGSTDADPGERFYWEVRNKVWMFTRSSSLSPTEKVAYGGSTLTRWIRTFIDSPDRRDACATVCAAGCVDAWSAPPRPDRRGARRRQRAAAHDAAAVLRAAPGVRRGPARLPRAVAGQRDRRADAAARRGRRRARRPGEPRAGADPRRRSRRPRPSPLVQVELQHNEGLGRALDRGLAACRHDVVARQDADDISLPERFERQLPLIEAGADLVGAGLLEFGEDEHDVVGQRTPPTSRGRDPPLGTVPRPVQPPDGRLPAGSRRGGRAATRTCR